MQLKQKIIFDFAEHTLKRRFSLHRAAGRSCIQPNAHQLEKVLTLSKERIHVVDTHTGGEPTRIVHDSHLNFFGETMQERLEDFRSNYDGYRRAVVCEPRGSDVVVGAWLTPPVNTDSIAGVIFFNNVGYLGMCGHGTIGAAVALEHLGRIGPGSYNLDTPVGTVQFELLERGVVRIQNVPSYRHRKQVELLLEPSGNEPGKILHGDIAWGGNWFFLCADHGLEIGMNNLRQLQTLTQRIRDHLDANGITGDDGSAVDHIELVGAPSSPNVANVRNYIMCPGAAYDRSPCGTGTCAKLACLAADNDLAPGEPFRIESVVGSVFEGCYQPADDGTILPEVKGTGFVNAEASLIFKDDDPFKMGLVT